MWYKILFSSFFGHALAEEALTEEKIKNIHKIGDLVTILYKWAIPLGSALAALVIIYAGYLYATSQGNPDSVKMAKDLIIGALVGLALIILAGVILRNVIGLNLP